MRGPNVFAGYWRNPEATAETMVDGWLRTGDLAERDDEGYYRISGRLKEMYISGGENVYPAEVEDACCSDRRRRRRGGARCARRALGRGGHGVRRPGARRLALGRGRSSSRATERLARFKVPASVRFLDELPRSGMNKVLKDELRAGVPA